MYRKAKLEPKAKYKEPIYEKEKSYKIVPIAIEAQKIIISLSVWDGAYRRLDVFRRLDFIRRLLDYECFVYASGW